MSYYKGRFWSKQEESLLIDIWESNIKDLENAGKKQIHEKMQREISLHSNISLPQMETKIGNLRRQYKKALDFPQYKEQWKPFDRVHAILNTYQKVAKKRNSYYTARKNGKSTDESILTIEDSMEFIGCDASDINIYSEPDINIYSEPDINAYQLTTPETSQSNDIIKLDDDNDVQVVDSQNCGNIHYNNSTASSAIEHIENQQSIISSELAALTNPSINNSLTENVEEQFAPIRAVQTIDETGVANFGLTNHYLQAPQSAAHSQFAPSIYLCEPVQPQQNIPVDIAHPNGESAFNLLPTSTTCSRVPKKNAKRKSAKTAKVQPMNINEDVSAAMLKTLTSIDDKLDRFIQMQDDLSRKMHHESLRNSIILTNIQQEEQRSSMLLESLITQIKKANKTI